MIYGPEIIAKRIKRYRENSKLTQEKLGEKVGLSRNEISNLECNKNNLSYKTLCDLCDALDICPCEFMCGADHKTIDDNIIGLIKHFDEEDKYIVYQMLITYKALKDDLKKSK